MAGKREFKQFHIGFSEEEWETVCKKASAAKMRNGTYVRTMAVEGQVKVYELKELAALKRAFTSIGKNINQIAANVNSEGAVYKKDIEQIQEEFEYFRDAMKNYMFDIAPHFF